MLDEAIGWCMSHPLECVGGLVIFAVAFALALIPRIHETTSHGHPRC
jgi:hypothetical protein